MTEAHETRPPAETAGDSGTANVRLRDARQAQNLTTADVARRLKLSVWQVEALESGQYHQLPGPVFVRGFIRNYARLLNLEPEGLVQSVAGLQQEAPPHLESAQSRDIPFPGVSERRWPRYVAAAVVIVALLAVYEFYYNQERPNRETPPPPVAAVTPSKVAPPAASERKAEEVAAKAPAATAVAAAPSKSPAPAPAPASAAPSRERVPHPDDRELRFVFDEESWVEIRDGNDQTIFSQLNRAGTTRRVVGLPPLHIVVGNAQGVRMTFAGREIDLARHTKIDVARLTLP